jgi:hypothetical protein
MSGIGSIMKLVRGGLGPDELGEILAAAGIDAEFSPLQKAQQEPEFQRLWKAASLPSSSLVRISMRMKDGSDFSGVLVLNKEG